MSDLSGGLQYSSGSNTARLEMLFFESRRFERDVSFTHSVIRLEGRFRECRFGAGSDFADARTDGERDFRGSQVAGRLRLDRARFASFSLDDDLGDGRDADAIHRFRQTVRVSL